MLKRDAAGIAEAIHRADRIGLISHVNPDGDTIGSTLALRLGLLELGKDVRVFCQDPVPESLLFLPGAEEYATGSEDEAFDLILSVDVSDEKRLGSCISLLDKAADRAQIDHHGSNPAFMRVNSVDPKASAAALLVYEQLKELRLPITADMACCLYAGLSTDTGNFAFDSVSEEDFRVMAALKETGFPMAEINRRLFRQRSIPQVRLLGKALSGMELLEDGRLTVMTLTEKDFSETDARPEDTDAIVNYGLDIRGVVMTAMLRERESGVVKLSLRAVAPYRVSEIAQRFGGGGHALAAGATLEMHLPEAEAAVVAEMRKALKEKE